MIENHINTLLDSCKDLNLLKYVYNDSKEFIAGKTPVYYSGPYWDKKEIIESIKTLLTGNWLSSGEKVKEFEEEFCKKFNQKFGVMVNSGSSANLVLIKSLKKHFNWKDGDEILLSVVGFPTTLSSITLSNLKPVFVDIEFDTLNFDLYELETKINSKTKAIFLSPVLGNCCDLDILLFLCKKYKLILILDNCDSLGSKWKRKYLNEYSIASSYSFYPAHHISTGEGGFVSSNNYEIVKTARSLAWWGRDCYCVGSENLLSDGKCCKRFSKWLSNYNDTIDHKYYFTNEGFNLKPLDLQGSIGLVQLSKFDEIHFKRNKSKETIQKIFEKSFSTDEIKIPNEINLNSSTSWFGTPIICKNSILKRNLVKHLEKNKIQTRNYFAGNILLHPAYEHLDDFRNYPESNKVLDRVFFIGASPHYNTNIFDYIESVIKEFKH